MNIIPFKMLPYEIVQPQLYIYSSNVSPSMAHLSPTSKHSLQECSPTTTKKMCYHMGLDSKNIFSCDKISRNSWHYSVSYNFPLLKLSFSVYFCRCYLFTPLKMYCWKTSDTNIDNQLQEHTLLQKKTWFSINSASCSRTI